MIMIMMIDDENDDDDDDDDYDDDSLPPNHTSWADRKVDSNCRSNISSPETS